MEYEIEITTELEEILQQAAELFPNLPAEEALTALLRAGLLREEATP